MSPRGAPVAGRHGPEFYWHQAKRFGEAGFTVAELHEKTRGVAFVTVRGYVDTLRKLGLVETIGAAPQRVKGHRPPFRYRVTKGLPVAPMASAHRHAERRRGAIQHNLWTAMRALPQFVISELAIVASTEDVVISVGTADVYVRSLVKAGLVITLDPSRPARGTRGHTRAVYRLLPSASSGPLPPCIVADRVYDPNRRAFVGRPLQSASTEPVAVSA